MNQVLLRGTAEQRGAAHGEQLREQISENVSDWLNVLAVRTHSDPHQVIREFVQSTNFEGAIRRWAPDLMAELRSLARAALQPYETLLAFNLMDEEWWWTWKQHYHAGAQDGHQPPGCTTVGIRVGPRGVPVLGQNMDLPRHYSGQLVLFAIEPGDGPNAVVLSTAGMLAVAGCNDAPLAVCVNTLMQLNSSGQGLPVAFTIRRVLEHDSAEAAVAFLRSIKHASGQNYAIADRHEIRDVECSASSVVECCERDERVAHANHPLANQDLDPSYRDDYPNSRERQRAAAVGVRSSQGIDDLHELLSDRSIPVCQIGQYSHSTHTFATIITELTSPPKVYLTAGPPHERDLEEVNWPEAAAT